MQEKLIRLSPSRFVQGDPFIDRFPYCRGSAGDDFSQLPSLALRQHLQFGMPSWRAMQLEQQGWRHRNRIQHLEEEMCFAEDLPLFETISAEESAQLCQLKREILKIQGQSEAPTKCWRAQFFTQGRLLCWLRGRSNDVAKASAWAVECIQYLDDAPHRARRFEMSKKHYHEMREDHLLVGLFGSDRLGTSVLYRKDGLIDVDHLVKVTTMDFFCDGEDYDMLIFYDTLHKESLRVGKCITNRVSVIDLAGSTLKRTARNMAVFDKQLGRFPHKEAPTPEGFRIILIRNTPSFFTRVWKLSKWMVTKRDQHRVHLFPASDKGDARYKEELFKHVDPCQVPTDFGGSCDYPWTFCGRSVQDYRSVSKA